MDYPYLFIAGNKGAEAEANMIVKSRWEAAIRNPDEMLFASYDDEFQLKGGNAGTGQLDMMCRV